MPSYQFIPYCYPAKPFQTYCVDARGKPLDTYPDSVLGYKGPLTEVEKRIYKKFLPEGVEFFDRAKQFYDVDLLQPTSYFLDKKGIRLTFEQEWDMMVAYHVRTVIASKKRRPKMLDVSDDDVSLPRRWPTSSKTFSEKTEPERTVKSLHILPPVTPIPYLYYEDNEDSIPDVDLNPPFQQVVLKNDPIRYVQIQKPSRPKDDTPRLAGKSFAKAFFKTIDVKDSSNATSNGREHRHSEQNKVYTLKDSIRCRNDLEMAIAGETRAAAIFLARKMSKEDIVAVLKQSWSTPLVGEFLRKPDAAFSFDVELRQPGETNGVLSFPREKVPSECFLSWNIFSCEKLENRLNIEELYFVEDWREMYKFTELHYKSHAQVLKAMPVLALKDKDEKKLVTRHITCMISCRLHFERQCAIHTKKMDAVSWYLLDADYNLGVKLQKLMIDCVNLQPTTEATSNLTNGSLYFPFWMPMSRIPLP